MRLEGAAQEAVAVTASVGGLMVGEYATGITGTSKELRPSSRTSG